MSSSQATTSKPTLGARALSTSSRVHPPYLPQLYQTSTRAASKSGPMKRVTAPVVALGVGVAHGVAAYQAHAESQSARTGAGLDNKHSHIWEDSPMMYYNP